MTSDAALPFDFDARLELELGRLRAYVRTNASAKLRTREGVDDVVQSTLREALGERARFVWNGEAAFRRWLYQLATRKIIEKSRRHAADKRSSEREELLASRVFDVPQAERSSLRATPSRHAAHQEDLERLERALATLDDDDRRIVSMRKLFDLSTKDIADELGLAESTVRWRLAQALAKLALRMG